MVEEEKIKKVGALVLVCIIALGWYANHNRIEAVFGEFGSLMITFAVGLLIIALIFLSLNRPNRALTSSQVEITLFEKAIDLNREGRLLEAKEHYKALVALNRNNEVAWNNLGNTNHRMRRPKEAIRCYIRAIRLRKDYAEAHNNIAKTLWVFGFNRRKALKHYDRALKLKPQFDIAKNSRDNLLTEILITDFTRKYGVIPTNIIHWE